jgi:superfamily II helicase
MSEESKKQQIESRASAYARSVGDDKLCPSCNKMRNLTEFHRNKSKADGHQANCKRCVAITKKKKYLKKKKEVRFRSEIYGCLEDEAIVSFSDVFSDAVLNLVDDGKL